jgi:Ca-activated chloride channel family protein
MRRKQLLNSLKPLRICGLLLLGGTALALVCLASGAQTSDIQSALLSQPATVIRVSSHLVTVPVSVTDTSGQAISGLQAGDFRIAEDGNAQVISKAAEASESPLQLALLFDLSGSLNSRFEFEQQAATRFLKKTWKDGDAACIVAFNEQPRILLKRSVFMSEVLEELSQLRPTENSTAFFDAVVLAARVLYQWAAPDTRQAVIVISDGADNRSECNINDALREMHHSDTIFYAINPSGASVRLNEVNSKGEEGLAFLAAATGGRAFVLDKTDDFDSVFSRIASELRAQYLLGYYSSNSSLDGGFRQISVSIPGRPDLHVRARQGYYATPK